MKLEPFDTLKSVAAPFPEGQIDTDVIFPARFLLLLEKEGLGKHLFADRRVKGNFVLDTAPWDNARILIAGQDFGSGSSREQAVWALADFGIKCVIAPSFGEIFYANCFRSCVLPIRVSEDEHAKILQEAEAARQISIDLPNQQINFESGERIAFEIDPHRKESLLLGLDEIGVILRDDIDEIAAFEKRQQQTMPWAYLTPEQLSHFNDIAG